MAAQPIVRDSYKEPVYTYETNVMGTVHVLECVRQCASVKSFVNVTTDKVYLNREWNWGYRENEENRTENEVILSNCGERQTVNAHELFEVHRKNTIRMVSFRIQPE